MSDRELAERVERLTQQGSVLEYIIEHVPHSIFWKDQEGRFLGGNRNLLRDVGVSSLEQLIGKTDYDLGFPKPQADHFRRCDLAVMTSGTPLLDIEEPQDQADGTHILLTSKVPLRDDGGAVIGLLGIYVDITERKRMEEELRQTRDAAEAASRAKGDFLTVVSHELRTPLTLISGPLDGMLDRAREAPLPPDVRAALERIRRNAGRLTTLVNDLLDFTRIEAGTMRIDWEAVDVAALTAELVADAAPAAARAGVRLEFAAEGEPTSVPADRRKLEKIALNLLGNALKFTPAGGRVTATVRTLDAEVELAVADTGPGIAKAQQALLFRRFQQIDSSITRKHEGTGIGLALVKELAERMGGRAGVDSELGHGARFFVRIPRSAERALPAAVSPAPVPRRAPGPTLVPAPAPVAPAFAACLAVSAERPRVVVAEDNDDMRGYLGELLAEHYDVEAVANGRQALQTIEARPPAVVVSDVMMPIMDGFELVAALKRDPALRAVPIILLTAKAAPGELVAGLDAGADDYLAKPFGPDELMARVHAARRLHDAYCALDEHHRELEAAHAELQRTQEQLVHAAKIAAVGTLVAGLSHELNNPLSVILMSTQSLLARTADADERENLQMIERHTRRCAQLVGRLLDFSRKKPAVRMSLCLRSLIDRVAELSSTRARRAAVRLDVQTGDELPLVQACAQEIETAVLNLVSNALDATPAGSSVRLDACACERQGRPGVEVAVRDSGHGIDPQALPHVWDPFFTTKPIGQGTGLGLAITRKVVDEHGGALEIDSGPGGTTVHLWLPAAPGEPALAGGPS